MTTSPTDPPTLEDLALTARTTVTVDLDGTPTELLVYWLDTLTVLDDGRGELVDAETGDRYAVTWHPELGYQGARAARGTVAR